VVSRIEETGEEAVRKILEMLKFDHEIRRLVLERIEIDPAEIDFLFGRPLTKTVIMFGLQVLREPDGSFFLTTGNPSIQ
jgi:hypothetical protein